MSILLSALASGLSTVNMSTIDSCTVAQLTVDSPLVSTGSKNRHALSHQKKIS